MVTVHTRRLTAVILCVVMLSACAKLSIPATVKQVSQNGTALMQVVQAMATAVTASEQAGGISRNRAIAVMATLSKVTDAATEVVKYLTLLMQTQAPGDVKSIVNSVVRALEVINTGLFQALIPIDDVTLKTDLGLLALEMSRTITIINRDILGRVANAQ